MSNCGGSEAGKPVPLKLGAEIFRGDAAEAGWELRKAALPTALMQYGSMKR